MPGVFGVYIGPSDLGFSHGLVPKLDREEPEMLRIYERVVAETAASAANTPASIAAAPPMPRAPSAWASACHHRSTTVSLMAMAAKDAVAQIRRESDGVA